MTIIGLTGPSGGGKSSALSALRGLGVQVIDCDAVYHELLIQNAGLLGELEAAFGGAVVSDGRLDRKALGRIVFSDKSALETLNAITHQYVGAEVGRRLGIWRAAGERAAAIEAIALIESGLAGLCDTVVGVTAPADVRVTRIMARDNISEEYARMRVAAQKPDSFYEENCDRMLISDCATPEEFTKKAAAFFSQILGGYNNG